MLELATQPCDVLTPNAPSYLIFEDRRLDLLSSQVREDRESDLALTLKEAWGPQQNRGGELSDVHDSFPAPATLKRTEQLDFLPRISLKIIPGRPILAPATLF